MSGDELSIGAHNLHVYEGLYRELNPQGAPLTPAGDAAAFLRRSGLPVQYLGQIWELADYAKRGALDKRGAFIAFKLVAAAQQGHPVVQSSIMIPGLNPPMLGSRTATPAVPSGPSSLQASPSRQSVPLPRSPSGGRAEWAIQPVDQAKYDSIFNSLSPENGKLPGARVRPVLLNSGLPPGVLAKIWEVADQDKDGQLDRVEMNVALHLVYRALQNEALPNSLPPSLIHPSKAMLSRKTSVASALDYGSQSIGRGRTGSMASLEGVGFQGPLGGMDPPRSYSVNPVQGRQPSLSGTPVPITSPSSEWPVDMTEANAVFQRCDTNRDGLVSGGDVMGEFLRSGLSQPTLAHIWTLADTHANGTLNPEQFALAMHLVSMARSGHDLPPQLPPHLIPPSMRPMQVQEPEPQPAMPSSASQYIAFAAQSENAELKQLADEMQRLIGERRETDTKITQLEADMTVKNSAIRNLQVELTTLENTVKQLERQKTEAGKRLNDMDTQIAQLEEQCLMQEEKVDEGQNRLDRLKEETENGAANAQKNAETLGVAQSELADAENEARQLSAQLQAEKSAMERAVMAMTTLERDDESATRKQGQMEAERRKIEETAEKLKKALESENPEEALAGQPELFASYRTPEMFTDAPSTSHAPPRPAMPNGNKPVPPRPAPPRVSPAPGFAADPFAGQDPFAGTGNNASGFADFSSFGSFN
ncbi:unnamed protein product, partial [Mesorhabditis spiculigera]